MLEYSQYLDPKHAEQVMAESLAEEDLPSTSLPRKGPASADVAEEGATQTQ
jgi:hypothetical protein